MITNKIIPYGGRNWLVREAISHYAAINAIVHADIRGSVSCRHLANDQVEADVVVLNDDGTEREPS